MPQYLEGLPGGATLGYAFSDLRGQGQDFVAELTDLVPTDYKVGDGEEGEAPVYGMDLRLVWDTDEYDGYDKLTTRVAADFGSRQAFLLSVTSLTFRGTSKEAGGGISAYRGAEGGDGDFQLLRRPTGLIECRLGAAGLGAGQALGEGTVVGQTDHRASHRLDRFDPAVSRRIAAIAQGVHDGFAAVELFKEGASADEVLRVMDRASA